MIVTFKNKYRERRYKEDIASSPYYPLLLELENGEWSISLDDSIISPYLYITLDNPSRKRDIERHIPPGFVIPCGSISNPFNAQLIITSISSRCGKIHDLYSYLSLGKELSLHMGNIS